jgi:hypothetical protein
MQQEGVHPLGDRALGRASQPAAQPPRRTKRASTRVAQGRTLEGLSSGVAHRRPHALWKGRVEGAAGRAALPTSTKSTRREPNVRFVTVFSTSSYGGQSIV